jgi:flavin-dependent dehydrogenase
VTGPVLVVGAGPAGSVTALLLAQRGVDVLLVDRTDFSAFRPGETLPPRVRPDLAQWDLWDRFVALSPTPCFSIEATWDQPQPRTIEHLENPYGCGWHVDRRLFDRMLFDAAVESGATGQLRTTLESLTRSSEGWTAALANEGVRTIATASFLVDGTGRRGAIARLLGRRRKVTDDRIALSAAVAGASDGALLVEAAPDGWWSSSVVGSTIAVTYVTNAATLRRERRPPDRVFRDELKQASRTRSRLAGAHVGRVYATVAGSSCLDSVAGPRWLAVGDAACTFDPISGLGVLKAFDDARRAVDVIVSRLDDGADDAGGYDTRVQRRFASYRRDRDAQYRLVRRWPASMFWAR